MILLIPQGFEQHLFRQDEASLQIQIDAINGMTAGLINGYASQIIGDFNRELRLESGGNAIAKSTLKNINTNYSFCIMPN